MSRTEQQARTRREVLDAAAEVFAEHGIQRTTIAQIAQRAGYTRGAVYSNFTGKEELALTLVEERIAVFLELLDAPGEALPADGTALDVLTERFTEFFTGPVPRLFHELRAQAIRTPELRDRLAERYRPVIDALAQLVSRRSPALADRRYAAGIAALANGISMETLANPELERHPELFSELTLALLAGLSAHAASSDVSDRDTG